MAADASQALGAPQVAGSFVMPKGAVMRAGIGSVGGVIGSVAAAATTKSQAGMPAFGRVGYLAVTADEIAIVKGKTGAFRPKVGDEVLARVPRSQIASADLDGKLLKADLKIEFSDGGQWVFDVPKANKKTAVQVVNALGGTVH